MTAAGFPFSFLVNKEIGNRDGMARKKEGAQIVKLLLMCKASNPTNSPLKEQVHGSAHAH